MFKLTIDTDSAAFEDDPDEVARILEVTAARLRHDDGSTTTFPLLDANGNTVGQATFS